MATCKTCGATIEFRTRRESGAMIPVQKITKVYRESGPAGIEDHDKGLREVLYVSHFETCPQASQHSKKGAKK